MAPSVQNSKKAEQRLSIAETEKIDELWKKMVDVGIVFDRKIDSLSLRMTLLEQQTKPITAPETEPPAEEPLLVATGQELPAKIGSCPEKAANASDGSEFMGGLIVGIAVGGVIAWAAYLRSRSRTHPTIVRL